MYLNSKNIIDREWKYFLLVVEYVEYDATHFISAFPQLIFAIKKGSK